MSLLTRRRVIAAKVETTEGTMETITVTEAGILASDVKFEADFKQNDRNIMLNSLSNVAPTMGARSANITFKAELKGAGAAYSSSVKPALSPYLLGCGMAETIVATSGSESATYLPASSGLKSLTIWVYEDGKIKKARGCRGTYKISGKVGEPVYIDFTFTGVYDSTVDSALVSPTFEATVPPVLMGSTLSLDSVTTLVAESFGIDIGNSINLRNSIGAADGYLSALLTSRKPTGSLNPEDLLVAGYDFLSKWKSGNQAALTIGPVAPATGDYNKFTISAPKCIYTKVGEGDRNGIQTAELSFNLLLNSGDDELSISFTK